MSYGLIAVLSLLPATLVMHRSAQQGEARDANVQGIAFWAALTLGVLGPVVWALALVSGQWHTGLGSALWVSVAATMALFAMLCWSVSQAWRLTPLLAPYMMLMGIIAVLVNTRPQG